MRPVRRTQRLVGAGPDVTTLKLCKSLPVRRSVLIVDDHAAFRSAASALLEAEGFRVVGEAVDGASALEAARDLRPDVVLLDVQLPDRNGFDVAEQLATEEETMPLIVFISSRKASAFRWRLAANPGWRFIAKSDLSGEALATVLS
jgi:DNA-binding NarL/FixJ family response regulator